MAVGLGFTGADQAALRVERRRRRARARGLRGPDLLTWTAVYRHRLAPGRFFDLVQHQFLADIYEDGHEEVVLCKAGQVGVSEYLISWVLWSADVRECTGLYVFPTDTHVSDFSAARLGPAIEFEVSEYLAELVVPAQGRLRGADRVGLKRVRDRFIYFRGAKVQPDGRAPQLRAIDADVLVLERQLGVEESPNVLRAIVEALGMCASGGSRDQAAAESVLDRAGLKTAKKGQQALTGADGGAVKVGVLGIVGQMGDEDLERLIRNLEAAELPDEG